MARAKWIWADVSYNDYRDEYRYYFYTEGYKLTCVHIDARQYYNSYFKVIGVSPKDANDRLNSVKYGVKLYLLNGFAIISGELWQLPKNRNSLDVAEKIYQISGRIKNFCESNEDSKKAHLNRQNEERIAWGKELKELIEYQNDYEISNTKNKQFDYDNFEPVTSAKIVGVTYKFILSRFNDGDLDEKLIGQELIISSTPFINPDDTVIRGMVVDYSTSEHYLILSFQSTIDFGKFPKPGFLICTSINISYRIQAKAVDDLVEGRSLNKSLLDILIDGKYKALPNVNFKSYKGLNSSQEKAVNLALHTEDFLLIQGPPGTGKTSIIVEMLKEFVDQGKRVLVSSKNHLAVDNVLEKCIKNNISCIRLGREEKIKLDSVRNRLIDRAAVELQKDIIRNCDKQQLELLEQIKDQESFCSVLNEHADRLMTYVELKEKAEFYHAQMRKRQKLIKVLHFYKSIQLYYYKALAIVTRNEEIMQKQQVKYIEFFEDKLKKDRKYVQADEQYNSAAKSRDVQKTIIDNALSATNGFKTFDYENKSRDEIKNDIEMENGLLEKLKNKNIIIRDWIGSLEQRQQSLYSLLLNSVMVVGATCIGINTSVEFKDTDFDVAIIDEAGQITIFDVIVPMSRAKKVILIGDHMQLPPTCDNSLVQEINEERAANKVDDEESIFDDANKLLGQSLFETLFYTCPDDNKIMLDQQYRMHPVIAEFISNEFYEGKYKSGVSSSARDLKVSVFENPLYFVDTANNSAERYELAEIDDDHNVYYNILEADIVSNILIDLLRNGIKPDDIGVITPYKRQKIEITETIRNIMEVKGFDEDEIIEINDKLEIDTVDSFQGRDKDIIIFSFTRSNEEHSIGFLRELRRLNVTMTRAKYLLIMVGDSSTLTKTRDDKCWRFFNNLMEYVKDNGIYVHWDNLKQKLSQGNDGGVLT
ncbi:MAG TPA: AAA family ATPase [Clostridiales bacterium]|nr:AAA family ATPase [Clostridiales bacterium]